MSDLYRSALAARIAKLPTLPHSDEDEDDDEESEAVDSLGSLPSTMGPPQAQRNSSVDHSPLSAAHFFDQATQVDVPDSGLDVRVFYTPPKFANGAVMICHHGAGHSGLTFACLAKEITSLSNGECGVLALDCRGHGAWKTTRRELPPPPEEDLSLETLTMDFVNLLKVVYPNSASAPTLLLVGHSLGGSVCVNALPLLMDLGYRFTGVAVLDIVEEFTLEALPQMHSLLDARRAGFDSPEDAIEFHVRTNVIRNLESARVSVPGLIVPSTSPTEPPYVWRTSLRDTAPYWTSWFTGLSRKFLAARAARLLVLAGTERLDRELMIGQMQGKFQLVVMPGVGHLLQEDDPGRLASVLVEFWRRNDRVTQGVKKVGEL
ncbi:protein phosphatase methylesterase [Sparassis latifolia]